MANGRLPSSATPPAKATNLWRTKTGRAHFYIENHAVRGSPTRTSATGEQCEHAEEVPDNADARSRPRQRAPPLPRADLKVIIRPSPDLIVRELRSHQVAKAIIQATGRASECKGEDFIVRLRRGSNVIIVSTPLEATAATLVKITSLTFQERPHPVKVYLPTPKDLSKGVVHGIDAGTSEKELLANLRPRNASDCYIYIVWLKYSLTSPVM
ncbi:hypothetical protein HPB52_016835 [Rhipicephalus sanguineus]|uniref:Uncharacterized protein n=1 Tax=Rhipicephalus sanguineus TaxID=34632 RepID=A0A9D4T2S2_RHISA|nr:hypothetical protein HPB52_016835 [Rhipicephalus sanguineus]